MQYFHNFLGTMLKKGVGRKALVHFFILFHNFKPHFLSSTWSKLKNVSAHQKEDFLRFSKLTLLLFLVSFLVELWPVKLHQKSHPFWRWYSSQKVAICSLKTTPKNAPHQKTHQMVQADAIMLCIFEFIV